MCPGGTANLANLADFAMIGPSPQKQRPSEDNQPQAPNSPTAAQKSQQKASDDGGADDRFQNTGSIWLGSAMA